MKTHLLGSGANTPIALLAVALLAVPASAKTRVRYLLRDFETGKVEDRARVAAAMGRAKEKRATNLLLEAFKPKAADPRESAAIAYGLGLSGDERAVEPLQNALDFLRTSQTQLGELPPNLQTLKLKCLEALGRIGGDAATATLMEAVNDKDPRAVEEAIRSLGRLQVKDAVPALQKLALEPGRLGQAAIEALAETGDKRAISTLDELQKSPDRMTATMAAYGLAALGRREALAKLEESLLVDPAEGKVGVLAAHYLVRLDKNAGLKHLHALCLKPDAPLASLAADALGKSGNARAAQPLAECLGSPDAGVRLMAARALAQIGGSKAMTALKRAKDDPNPSVRVAAVSGLADWGEEN